MRKLRPKSLKEVIEKYKEQYPRNCRFFDGKSSNNMLQELLALPPKASPKQIFNVIGNESWARHFCAECKEYFSRGIAFEGGEAEMYVCNSRIIYVCNSCIRKALKL